MRKVISSLMGYDKSITIRQFFELSYFLLNCIILTFSLPLLKWEGILFSAINIILAYPLVKKLPKPKE